MSCNLLCGCSNPIGLLKPNKKKDIYIDCDIYDYYFLEGEQAITHGSYTIPKDGWYVTYISSHGADISRVMIYYPQGTNTIINYYTKGQKINYRLGSNSAVQNKTGEWVEAGVVSGLRVGHETYKAKVVFQYIGLLSEPVLILDHSFREGVNDFNRFLAGTPFDGKPRVIEPQLTDIVYNNTGHKTFSFFTVTEFTVPESKVYRVGQMGDDYANVYIDGSPASWLASGDISRSKLITGKGSDSAYNTLLENDVYLTAGKHTLVLWNCSPICCNISAIVAVKDLQTKQVYAYDTQYNYVRSGLNCLGEIATVKFKFKADNDYNQYTTSEHANTGDNHNTAVPTRPDAPKNQLVTWKVERSLSAWWDEAGRGSGNVILYKGVELTVLVRKLLDGVPTEETREYSKYISRGTPGYSYVNHKDSLESVTSEAGLDAGVILPDSVVSGT